VAEGTTPSRPCNWRVTNISSPCLCAGHEYLIAMPLRSRVELVVTEADQERVIQAISGAVRTEAAGSGKIFVEKVEDAIRIRTGESGTDAV